MMLLSCLKTGQSTAGAIGSYLPTPLMQDESA